MRSLLTHRVFRQLLSPEGLVFHCPTQNAFRQRPHGFRAIPRYGHGAMQRRALWGFSRKTQKPPKVTSNDPGTVKMHELQCMQRMGTRPPPARELVIAWRQFFRYFEKSKESFNRHQAGLAVDTLKHLTDLKSTDPRECLTLDDIRAARKSFVKLPKRGELDKHAELARLLHTSLQAIPCAEGEYREETPNPRFLVEVLTRTGYSAEARDTLQTWINIMENKSEGKASPGTRASQLWVNVMEGFVKENNEEELLRTREMAPDHVESNYWLTAQLMIKFYIKQENTPAAKEWFNKAVDRHNVGKKGSHVILLSASLLRSILQCSIRNNELEWCKKVFKHTIDNHPDKPHWDVILQWAAGAMGQGVEDVDRMMEVMVTRGKQPDIATINGLVEMAISLDDSYLAERYISLGKERGIQPNAETFILQMDYRAGANDLRGARAAYEALASEEILDDADLPAVNKYLRALCSAKKPNYDLISSIIADLDERNKRLEPDTVASLSLVMLNYQEIEAVVDILLTNIYHYNVEERARIRNGFVKYCLDPWNSTAKSWDAYNIFRIAFEETEIDIRTQMMNEFFRRRRSDMAVHIFGHMRQHDNPTKRPVLETYVDCFVGIAKMKDREHLDMVHNMLKLDSSIEPNTRLYNALMLAFTACNDAHRAYQFWEDITQSFEGPSYNSLEIVFWACSKMPFGDEKGREIWKKMKRMQVEITREVFAGYLGALSRMAEWDEIKDLLESCRMENGFKVDALMLGTIYNAMPAQVRRDRVEEYSKEKFPAAWADLRKFGRYKTSRSAMRYFQMKVERNP